MVSREQALRFARAFARVPVVTLAPRVPAPGVAGGAVEPLLTRRGAKNRGWFFRAVETQKEAAAASKIPKEYVPGDVSMGVCRGGEGVWLCGASRFHAGSCMLQPQSHASMECPGPDGGTLSRLRNGGGLSSHWTALCRTSSLPGC
jgi:hypothetical protein